jgi:addiction module HigA family antidote
MSTAPRKIGMAPPYPGAFIRDEILDELGLSVSEAADVLDVRRATLSDLVNCKAALSPEMALRVEKAFGVKMERCWRCRLGTTYTPSANAPARSWLNPMPFT